jgi:hypothetical protein
MNAVHNADALTWNEGKTMQVTFDPNSLDDYRRSARRVDPRRVVDAQVGTTASGGRTASGWARGWNGSSA